MLKGGSYGMKMVSKALQMVLHTVNHLQGCERIRNEFQGWERNWNENSRYGNGNGTGTERVPVADFGTRTELSSTLAERNRTERSSEIFGTDPITVSLYTIRSLINEYAR